jgi:type II secretory pathway component PulF
MPTTTKFRKRYSEEDESLGALAYHSGWPYLTLGFGDEKDYFIENLSLLVASGMGITAALESMRGTFKHRKMKRVLSFVEDEVNNGSPLWKALLDAKFLPPRMVYLVKSGEESGRLPEHLNLVTIQQHKERVFISRIRSALLYPTTIFIVAIVVGLGSAWYTLPKLVSVLEQVNVALPFTTLAIISVGNFIQNYGLIFFPCLILGILVFIYFVFFNSKTKVIGEYIIFGIPGVKQLVQGVEVARFGYIFGALLQAGIVIPDALDSLAEGASMILYKRFYINIRDAVVMGKSFQQSIKEYKQAEKLIPLPMQQLIFSAEKSGKLSETLLRIGQIFEEKTDSMAKDLSTILEPLILLIVGAMVGLIALGIISPIYSLVNQIGS